MTFSDGFLVVLKSPEGEELENRRYRGVDRLPPYPPKDGVTEEEAEALDAYVFGDYKNESGCIPDRDRARELMRRFGPSAESLELIYTRIVVEDAKPPWRDDRELLGFDVAGTECGSYSIVGDFPVGMGVDAFFHRLNEHGLFRTAADAVEYLDAFRNAKLQHHDTALAIWEVYLTS